MSIEKHFSEEDSVLLKRLESFSESLPALGGTLGITPAEISSLKALILSVKQDMRRDADKSEDKESKKQSMLVTLQNIVERMKRHPAYDEATHGERLRF